MAGTSSEYVAFNGSADQEQVADEVDHLVAHRFIIETERDIVENSGFADERPFSQSSVTVRLRPADIASQITPSNQAAAFGDAAFL
jgi:hypothetical protein